MWAGSLCTVWAERRRCGGGEQARGEGDEKGQAGGGESAGARGDDRDRHDNGKHKGWDNERNPHANWDSDRDRFQPGRAYPHGWYEHVREVFVARPIDYRTRLVLLYDNSNWVVANCNLDRCLHWAL